ncbi:hypothetical protein OAK01_03290 [Candidatus Nitrosopelagicus sp.]|nr:hypothetical protein [Candidatus Nitrosopelagicus sp.]
MVEKKTKLSIFDTFKTKTQHLTGEAKRQRLIIQHLTDSTSSASKTRTAISQKIAEENGIKWKNIYSGVFRDLDEVLIPLGLVEEEGRLPLKRGPKALQQNGMPFYHLTNQGLLVALSITEVQTREIILEQIVAKTDGDEKDILQTIQKLISVAPTFGYSLFERYIKTFCHGNITELRPFTIVNLKKSADKSSKIQMELLEGVSKLQKIEREDALEFLKKIE